MPIVSSFFGIVIRMYFTEHQLPHFHAEYQGQEVACSLNGAILRGQLRSSTAARLIREWAACHQQELMENWHRVRNRQPLEPIPPLK